MAVVPCSHETTAGSGETHSEESSGSHQEPEEDAGFFDVKNAFKPPPGIVLEPGFHNVKNDFKLPPGPISEP
eukprot:2521413-Prorocentrum_lima.AAC.1